MASLKATFTLDRSTVRKLDEVARALSLPKSRVIREAVNEYAERVGKLPEAERRRLLAVFDEWAAKVPAGSARDTDKELRELRTSRRGGGRSTP